MVKRTFLHQSVDVAEEVKKKIWFEKKMKYGRLLCHKRTAIPKRN